METVKVNEGGSKVKNLRKESKKKLKKFEKATYGVPATYSGITYLSLLGITQVLYVQKKYTLVCNICDAAIKSIKKSL